MTPFRMRKPGIRVWMRSGLHRRIMWAASLTDSSCCWSCSSWARLIASPFRSSAPLRRSSFSTARAVPPAAASSFPSGLTSLLSKAPSTYKLISLRSWAVGMMSCTKRLYKFSEPIGSEHELCAFPSANLTSSVLPPPISMKSPSSAESWIAAPRKLSRPSSSPLIRQIFIPVFFLTCVMTSSVLSILRSDAVANTEHCSICKCSSTFLNDSSVLQISQIPSRFSRPSFT